MKTNILKFIIIVVLGSILLYGCKDNKIESDLDSENIEKAISKIIIPTNISDGINLVTKDEETGTTISWVSSDESIMTSNGVVYATDEMKAVTLTATFKKGNKEKSVVYSVEILTNNFNLFENAYDDYRGYINTPTIKDLRLNTKNYGQFSVSYESLTPNILTDDGIITQSKYDEKAILQMTLQKGLTKKVYEIEIVIKQYNVNQVNKLIDGWLETKVNDVINGTTQYLPIECDLYDNVSIVWNADEFGLIANDGFINRPVVKKNLTISCKLSIGNIDRTNYYTLNDFGGNTVEAFNMQQDKEIKSYLDSLLKTEIKGSKNYLTNKDDKGEQYLNYQVRTNVGGVLNRVTTSELDIDQSYFIDVLNEPEKLKNNLFYGTHPEIPQDILDKYFYPGYTCPNKENILWIVVHESGMPIEGQDAKLLAELQWNSAYYTDNPREASWNYQVDAYKIYQSFDDNIACWHAGGSQTILPRGNSNGIGIEMCINQDGNYEGAMHNNAKLIAYLLHKYNLTLANVKRHYDFSGKECPSYMIRTNRWNEFLDMIKLELTAIEVLEGATINWTVDNLSLFENGDNYLLYNKAVDKDTPVEVTLEVIKGSFYYKKTQTLILKSQTN